MHFDQLSDTWQAIIVLAALAVYFTPIGIWSAKALKRGVKTRKIALTWAIAVSPLSIISIVTSYIRRETDLLLDAVMVAMPFVFYYVLVIRINYQRQRRKSGKSEKGRFHK